MRFKNYMSPKKVKYRDLCTREPSIPLFSQFWWLDALVGEGGWDVALVESGSEIVAAMPYVVRRKFGKTLLGQPPLTQNLGPWLRETGAKQANRLSRQKELMEKLIADLPFYDHFSQSWDYRQTNWLPFYWAGYTQTSRYTYRLSDLSDEQELWFGLRENIRSDIRKAQNRFGIQVRSDFGIDAFLRLNAMTFARQDMEVPVSPDLVRKLDAACAERGGRRIFIAEDAEGKQHAAVYIVWDSNNAYYLMGGGDPELRSSGATSLCMWEAIKYASSVARSFDFEGSMIEPVERFFRAFGATQTEYFSLTRTPSHLLKTIFFIRQLQNRD